MLRISAIPVPPLLHPRTELCAWWGPILRIGVPIALTTASVAMRDSAGRRWTPRNTPEHPGVRWPRAPAGPPSGTPGAGRGGTVGSRRNTPGPDPVAPAGTRVPEGTPMATINITGEQFNSTVRGEGITLVNF